MRLYTKDEMNQVTWSGGTTRELFIYPDGSNLKNRNFIFRLSSARSDEKNSTFSDFSGYDRILLVLEGHIKLVHNQQRHVSLNPYEQDAFYGEDHTECFGKLLDFNVISKRGVQQRLEVVKVSNESIGFVPAKSSNGKHFIFIYSAKGKVEVANTNQKEVIHQGDLLSVETLDEEYYFTSEEDAILLITHIVI